MRSSLECIPCFARQAIDAVRVAVNDEAQRMTVMRRIMGELSLIDFRQPPPVAARTIHRILRSETGVDDPFRGAKERFTAMAMELLPSFEKRIARYADRFAAAVRLAVAGNVIDLGAKGDLTEEEAFDAVGRALDEPVAGDIGALERAVSSASKILYVADNAGELVFDRPLIGMLPAGCVTVAVRGVPVINDATREDAVAAGIPDIAAVIDNGSDAPGTVLEDCGSEFLRAYQNADLVISKGQGNYETLSDEDKNIFFLFKVKCPVVAGHSGLGQGTHAVLRGG
ncbi:MAG: DUF89 family protein [Spirochaetes bacterium]|nr:DUF89 family protein [Spirochaetota bacterium]